MNLLDTQKYTQLVKFLLESVNEILKQECRDANKTDYLYADFAVLLDCCVKLQLITEPAHASLMHLYQLYQNSLPKMSFAPSMKISQLVKSNTWRYTTAASQKIELMREDAVGALIIAYDFLKENQAQHSDWRYEPFLSLFSKARAEEDRLLLLADKECF